jgi:hypothetical protein
VRVSNEARLRVRGEGVDLDAHASARDGLTIDLSGSGDLVVRRIAPHRRSRTGAARRDARQPDGIPVSLT